MDLKGLLTKITEIDSPSEVKNGCILITHTQGMNCNVYSVYSILGDKTHTLNIEIDVALRISIHLFDMYICQPEFVDTVVDTMRKLYPLWRIYITREVT